MMAHHEANTCCQSNPETQCACRSEEGGKQEKQSCACRTETEVEHVCGCRH